MSGASRSGPRPASSRSGAASTGHDLWTAKAEGMLAVVLHSVAFSPDGKRLAVSGSLGTAVLDAASGARLLELKASGDVAFSPDGRRIMISGKVFDAAKGDELSSLPEAGLGHLRRRRDSGELPQPQSRREALGRRQRATPARAEGAHFSDSSRRFRP